MSSRASDKSWSGTAGIIYSSVIKYVQQIYSTNKSVAYSDTIKQYCDVKYCITKLLGLTFQLHSSSVESQ